MYLFLLERVWLPLFVRIKRLMTFTLVYRREKETQIDIQGLSKGVRAVARFAPQILPRLAPPLTSPVKLFPLLRGKRKPIPKINQILGGLHVLLFSGHSWYTTISKNYQDPAGAP